MELTFNNKIKSLNLNSVVKLREKLMSTFKVDVHVLIQDDIILRIKDSVSRSETSKGAIIGFVEGWVAATAQIQKEMSSVYDLGDLVKVNAQK